eukprot:357367-Chlamydomonas_euryale.AAC.5
MMGQMYDAACCHRVTPFPRKAATDPERHTAHLVAPHASLGAQSSALNTVAGSNGATRLACKPALHAAVYTCQHASQPCMRLCALCASMPSPSPRSGEELGGGGKAMCRPHRHSAHRRAQRNWALSSGLQPAGV